MKEYNHYYKKVPEGVEYIDVYRVLEMFDVSNPSIQHAIKKLLVAGGRGHKDIHKDIKEAIDSLNRWLEMREEDDVKTPEMLLIEKSSKDTINVGAVGSIGPFQFGPVGTNGMNKN
jgi:hypothetical protein